MFQKNKFLIISVSVLLPTIYFFVTYSNKSNVSISLSTINNSVLKNGKQIYAQNCSSCHGVNLEGQKNWQSRLPDGLMPAPPHDNTGHT